MSKIRINNIDLRILETRFACDLNVCKGACCTFPGGLGAPVTDEEVPLLHEGLAVVRNDLPQLHRECIDAYGIVERHGNSLHIRCVDQRACVFVTYESGIAVCSLQRAYERGDFHWIKPASCHLFPIRVSRSSQNERSLRFEEFSECEGALRNGTAQNVLLADFLAPAVARVFGETFAAQLCTASAKHTVSDL